jgi:hypothetical protein
VLVFVFVFVCVCVQFFLGRSSSIFILFYLFSFLTYRPLTGIGLFITFYPFHLYSLGHTRSFLLFFTPFLSFPPPLSAKVFLFVFIPITLQSHIFPSLSFIISKIFVFQVAPDSRVVAVVPGS